MTACNPILTKRGVVVEVDESTCRKAIDSGLKFYMNPEGRCYLPYDVAVKLGVCREEPASSSSMPVQRREPVNPALRFMELLEKLDKRGRGTRGAGISLSDATWKALDTLASRLRKPRSLVAEALLRLALEAIGVAVEDV